MGGFFNWPPYVLVALDADTGKPLDPNVGMRVKREFSNVKEFYDVRRDKNGKRMLVMHKSNRNGTKAGVEDAKKSGNGNGKDKGKGNSGGGGGGENLQSADAEWTAEEDTKLKAMKAEQKSWKDISTELGRDVGAVKKHWKEIGSGGNDRAAKTNDGGKGGWKEKSETKSQWKKASTKVPSKAGSNGEARFTMHEWMTLQEDDLFSFGELQCLSELIMRDDRMRWLRIAGAFFDKTGRRVHQDDIREKFEEMGAMG